MFGWFVVGFIFMGYYFYVVGCYVCLKFSS